MEDNHKNDFRSLTIFNRSAHFAYIYEKTEKLVTAVYMITNFIKDNEPLKWKIRENALGLMSLNIAFNTVSLSERRDLLKQYQALSLEIVSLSGIAFHSGLISEMNHTILTREFKSLVSIIEKDENKKANEETVVLDPGFFETPRTSAHSATQISFQAGAQATPETKGSVGNVLYNPLVTNIVGGPAHDKGHEHALPNTVAPSKPKNTRDTNTDSKDIRRASILRLLSKKSGLSIQDFTETIKGVSVKTIQRELLAMVASGILKKEGERRWSTYSLAK